MRVQFIPTKNICVFIFLVDYIYIYVSVYELLQNYATHSDLSLRRITGEVGWDTFQKSGSWTNPNPKIGQYRQRQVRVLLVS